MSTRMSNISHLFADQKTRTIIVVTGIILISMAIWGFFRLANTANNTRTDTANIAGIPNIESIPDPNQSLSPAMVQNIKTSDQQRLESAKKENVSAIPTLLPQSQEATPIIPTEDQAKTEQTTSPTVPSLSTPKQGNIQTPKPSDELANNNRDLAQSQRALVDAQTQIALQQAQIQQQALQAAMQKQQQLSQNMQSQAQAIFSAWSGKSGVPSQTYVQGKLAKEIEREQSNNKVDNIIMPNINDGTSTEPALSKTKAPASIKAGDLVFGILTTQINSDEPGPILATISSGKYRGAKLVGAVQKSPSITGTNGPETVILSFTNMNVKNLPNSISVNAIAIDPDTARTALASEVDYHRLYRYGTLFASSFLSGYGNAIAQSGSVVINNTDGSQTTFQQELNPTETFLSAVGQIGTELGNKLSNAVDRPNTITVDNGISIGILFLSDVTIDSTAG